VTPYVLSIHTDTFVKHPGWLDVLLSQVEKESNIAGVGSWKLENKPFLKKIAKSLEHKWQGFYYGLIGKTDHALEGKGNNYYYLRSHCALYRMEPIKKMNLTFSAEGETAGKVMHKKLIESGYKMAFLPSESLSKYVVHLNHATMVVHSELGARKKTIVKGQKRIKRGLKVLKADQILKNNFLDD
ncbi:MAG: glycosyltransferase, partial [Deltaproteobacteria bacterium]|nr:glycosyltransferase [Deltaproteobacteria bacterium]